MSKVHGIGHKPLAFVVLIFTHKTVYSANLRSSNNELRAVDHPTGVAGPIWNLFALNSISHTAGRDKIKSYTNHEITKKETCTTI